MSIQLIKQFNRFSKDNASLLQKALTSATGVGEALTPQSLEKIITDTVVRMSPELAMITPKKIGSKLHEYNQVTSKPARGGAMGENATTVTTNSKTARKNVSLKIVRRKGKVTNFLVDTSAEYIDAASFEMENQIQSHIWDMIYYILYGNADGNAYEFDGLDKMIGLASTGNRTIKAAGGVVPTSLGVLDSMIDKSNRKGGNKHRRAFVMSPEMLSKFSQLLTNVRLNQGLNNGMSQVDVPGGWRLNAYRDIPIIESTAVAPIQVTSPTITLTGVASGGSLSDGTYYVQVAAMTLEGEQIATAESSITLSAGGSAQRIKVTLSAGNVDAAGDYNALAYKIYVSQTTGTEKLNKYVSAFYYDAEGSVSDSIVMGTAGYDYYITSLTPGADVPTHMQNDVPYNATAGVYPETLFLWDLDPIQGLGKLPYANRAGDLYEGLITTQPLAQTDDYIQFLVKSYCALAPSFEQTSVMLRGVRTA